MSVSAAMALSPTAPPSSRPSPSTSVKKLMRSALTTTRTMLRDNRLAPTMSSVVLAMPPLRPSPRPPLHLPPLLPPPHLRLHLLLQHTLVALPPAPALLLRLELVPRLRPLVPLSLFLSRSPLAHLPRSWWLPSSSWSRHGLLLPARRTSNFTSPQCFTIGHNFLGAMGKTKAPAAKLEELIHMQWQTKALMDDANMTGA
jgi:hypothetical protein